MSTAKHTPGPWHVRTLDCSLGTIDASNDNSVAQAFEVSVDDRRAGHHERKANALLIAAAPELLEALQELVDSEYEFAAVAHKARLVIAKATGVL